MGFPKVLPFRGILYDQALAGNMADVVSPPYDVIDDVHQKELYDRSPNNFVRVDFPRQPGDLRYEVARKTYVDWFRQKVLVRDPKPAIYFHHQTFRLPDGREITRRGFFAARRLEEFSEGGIKPHEKTLDAPKADRLKMMHATRSNLSAVFSLYADPANQIEHLVSQVKKTVPLFDFVTREGERHQLWREEDPLVHKFVADILENQPILIADGHHRYETALNFRNEMHHVHPNARGLETINYLLMYFTNRCDSGLVVLPIHRGLHGMTQFHLEDFISLLRRDFQVTPLEGDDPRFWLERLEQERAAAHAFVLVGREPGKAHLVAIKRRAWKNSPVAATVPSPLVELDVTVLHRLVLEEILRLNPEAQAKQEHLTFFKDPFDAVDSVRGGGCDCLFLLNATRLEDLERVTMAGERMPQKSTFFHPKIVSGLVVNPLDPAESLGFSEASGFASAEPRRGPFGARGPGPRI